MQEMMFGEPNQNHLNDWVDLSASASTHQIDKAILDKWTNSFGDDFQMYWLAPIYIVRPKGGKGFIEWCRKFEDVRALPTLMERRKALYDLIGEYCFKLKNEEARDTVADRLLKIQIERPERPRNVYAYNETSYEREDGENRENWWQN